MRYTLEHELSYEDARTRLKSTELMGPCYLTLAGRSWNEGVIMECGRDSVHLRSFFDPFENPKFLVQTNHDVPKPPTQNGQWAGDDPLLNEFMGMGTVSRRIAAIEFLETLDELNLNMELMHMLTSHRTVSNSLTIFSSILKPADNHLEWISH